MPVKGFDKYPIADHLGSVFGEWTVVAFSHRNGSGHSVWRCQCSCGAVKNVNRTDLFSGKSLKCRNCAACNHDNRGLVKSWYMTRLMHGAISRELTVSVTLEDLCQLWEEQQGLCALTKLPLTLGQCVKDSQTASLDRIDSSRGYVYDNVQWVHKTVNTMKMEMTQEDFIMFCKLVATNS